MNPDTNPGPNKTQTDDRETVTRVEPWTRPSPTWLLSGDLPIVAAPTEPSVTALGGPGHFEEAVRLLNLPTSQRDPHGAVAHALLALTAATVAGANRRLPEEWYALDPNPAQGSQDSPLPASQPSTGGESHPDSARAAEPNSVTPEMREYLDALEAHARRALDGEVSPTRRERFVSRAMAWIGSRL